MKKIFYAFSLAFCLAASLTGCKEKDMSMKMNNPRNIKGVISYKRSFGDLNDAHLSAAQRIGVSPLQNRAAAEKLGKKVDFFIAVCDNATWYDNTVIFQTIWRKEK